MNRFFQTRAMHYVTACCIVCVLSTQCARKPVQVDTRLQQAMLLVSESWYALDTVVNEVWPGWDCYRNEIYFTAVPRVQDIMINPPEKPGRAYRLLGTAVQGKPVYTRTPGEMDKVWGGAHRFNINKKRYKAVQFHPPSREYSRRVLSVWKKQLGYTDLPSYAVDLACSAEMYMRIIFHEAFHRLQEKMNKAKAVNASHRSAFSSGPLLLMEGRILADAFTCTDTSRLIELSRQFLAVRQKRRGSLFEDDIHWERRNEYIEGSAEYVETKAYLALSRQGYTAHVLSSGKHGYSGFSHKDELTALLKMFIEKSPGYSADESQAVLRCYFFGMAQGFILDRLCGHAWKKNFFDDGVYFETLLAQYSGYSTEMAQYYVEKAKEYARL